MSGIGRAIILISLLFSGAVNAMAAENTAFYVAKNGSDAWSGKLAAPNKAGTDGPFATLVRARDAIRAIRKPDDTLPSPVTVYLRKGIYYLDSPFVLEQKDSGMPECPITYEAYGNEKAVISGGKQIEGFRKAKINGREVIAANIPRVSEGKWYFKQLFVNDHRRSRTRLPKSGYYQVGGLLGSAPDAPWNEGQNEFKYTGDEVMPWSNLNDVDIVALHFWIESRMHIKSIDETDHVVHLDRPSKFKLVSDHSNQSARYYVENVMEALDTPGQWYLDRGKGILYYYPYTGENIHQAQFIAPSLERLIEVKGTKTWSVEHVIFRNLRFAHTEYTLPPGSSGSPQAAVDVPGAIYFEQARHCSIDSCEISQIGTYGIEIGSGCENIDITSNSIHDMGAGGIKINQGSEYTRVENNEISDGGKLHPSGVGVWIGNSPHNRVLRNSITDLYYTGVSVGWVWGYGQSLAVDNLIEYNRIARIGRGVLSDLGGIYTLGVSPGTRLRNNVISDCISHSYGGWGIYTDEGSTDIEIENNIVYNTKTGGFHQHYGKENIVRNNIFAFAAENQLQRTRQEPHISFTFTHNIIYFMDGVLLGSNWDNDKYVMDSNIYWNASNKPFNFAGASFEDWQKRGHDKNSRIIDPLFIDAQKHNFALRPDSPALKLGFKPIDTSAVGAKGLIGPHK